MKKNNKYEELINSLPLKKNRTYIRLIPLNNGITYTDFYLCLLKCKNINKEECDSWCVHFAHTIFPQYNCYSISCSECIFYKNFFTYKQLIRIFHILSIKEKQTNEKNRKQSFH